MKRLRLLLPALVAGILILSACTGAGDVDSTPGVETFIPETGGTEVAPTDSLFPTDDMIASPTVEVTEMTSTPLATSTMEQPTEAATLAPTQDATLEPGIPPTGGEIEALTEMLRYRVVDNAGNELGRVRDYIVNTCEAHILYIVLAAETGNESVLIPYEAVSLNQDRPEDATNDELVVSFDAALLANVPTINLRDVDFEDGDWDASVMAFWEQNIPISLTTACNVPGGSGTAVPTLLPTLLPTGTVIAPTAIAPSATAPAVTETPESTEVVPSETPVSGAGFSGAAFQATSTPPPTVSPGGTIVAGTPIVTQQPGNRVNVFKNALVSDLIGANVVDARNNMVAKVRDALVLKSTGAVRYFVVQLVAGNQQDAEGNLIVLPPGAVNLFYDDSFVPSGNPNAGATQIAPTQNPTQSSGTPAAGTPVGGESVGNNNNNANRGNRDNDARFDRPVLVLLVNLSVLQNAPAFNFVDGNIDQDTFDYWSQFVPMTREALP